MFSVRKSLTSLLVAGAAIAMTAGAAHAASGVTGTHATASIGCNRTSPYSAYTPAPKMLAVNRMAGTDYQTVVFQPVSFKWSGTAWVQYSTGMPLYGTASDSHTPTTWYDLASHKSMGSGTTNLTLPGKGYWKVAYKMWWYSNPSTISGSDYQWASGYYTMSAIGAVTPASYCTT
jgi:hypothetical protein